MTYLLNDEQGRNAVIVAQKWLCERRLSRFWKRNFVRAVESWRATGVFDLATLTGDLNPAHDSELRDLYRLLGVIGGLETSVQDESYFVSPSGSDVTGDGTQAKPYASLWFLRNLPRRINHWYRIIIDGDISYNDLHLDFDFGFFGSLSFVGVGYNTISSGHVVSTAYTNLGGGWNSCKVVLPSPIWTVDQVYGNFLRWTSGPQSSMAFSIFENGGDYVVFRNGQNTPTPGDTFDIVHPRSRLAVNTLVSKCTGSRAYQGVLSGRINFVNLTIGVSALTYGVDINNACDMSLPFCDLRFSSFSNSAAKIAGRFGCQGPIDSGLAAVSGLPFANLYPANVTENVTEAIGTVVTMNDETVPSPSAHIRDPLFSLVDGAAQSWLTAITSRWDIAAMVAGWRINDCGMNALMASQSGLLDVACLKGEPNVGPQWNAAIYIQGCHAELKNFVGLGPAGALVMVNDGPSTFRYTAGGYETSNPPLFSYGFWFAGLANVFLAGNPAIFTGLLGDVHDFTFGIPVLPPWPAILTAWNNGNGSNLVRGSV